MPNVIPISQLNNASLPLSGNESFVIVQGGSTLKVGSSALGGGLGTTYGSLERSGGSKVLAGINNYMNGGSGGTIVVGGSANKISPLNTSIHRSSAIVAGTKNTLSGSDIIVNSVIVAGEKNNINPTGNPFGDTFNNFIGAGSCNEITALCNNFIGAGGQNIICGNFSYSSIGGGRQNTTSSGCSFIGGGDRNETAGDRDAIGGGRSNYTGGTSNFIGAGSFNVAECDHTFIGGGASNEVHSHCSTIGGGYGNEVQDHSNCNFFSTIGGGYKNYSKDGARMAFVGGGFGNGIVNNAGGVIGGGYMNCLGNIPTAYCPDIQCGKSVIAGGQSNSLSGFYGFIGGGCSNSIQVGRFDTIGGGYNNSIDALNGCYNTIAGGLENKMQFQGGLSLIAGNFIGGGRYNQINGTAFFTRFNVIAGGCANCMEGQGSFIGGGFSNNDYGTGANVIGGGQFNEIGTSGIYTTIAGGNSNIACGNVTFIGGGFGNKTYNNNSTVVGGLNNTAIGNCSGILGGKTNTIQAAHNDSFITGSTITSVSSNMLHAQRLYLSAGALPTSDPGVAGVVWNDSGTLKISV